jgi:hypothetical protein
MESRSGKEGGVIRVPGAAQHAFVMRCETGTATEPEFGKAPDQRRTTLLTLVRHRIRGTHRAHKKAACEGGLFVRNAYATYSNSYATYAKT